MNNYETGAALLLSLAVLLARMGTALAMFPMFATGALPISVRGTIVAGLAIFLLPAIGLDNMLALGQRDGVSLALLLAKEVAIGFGLGLAGSMAFWALHAAGALIENQAGLSMAATIDPLAGEEDSLLGGFLVQVLSVFFLASGGLLSLLGVLYESFRVWPLAELVPRLEPTVWLRAAEQGLRLVGELALRVAAPFLLLMLMVEVAMGLFGRYTPSFDVFFLALPIKAAVLLALLLVYAVVLADGSVLPDVAGAMRQMFPRP